MPKWTLWLAVWEVFLADSSLSWPLGFPFPGGFQYLVSPRSYGHDLIVEIGERGLFGKRLLVLCRRKCADLKRRLIWLAQVSTQEAEETPPRPSPLGHARQSRDWADVSMS
jgi:hypothetical protein